MLLICAIMVTFEVVLRKLFVVSVGGANEYSGDALAIGACWAFGYTLLNRGHIRIVFENPAGQVPTALVALDIGDAERLRTTLNARLGLSGEEWTALEERSMRAEMREPDDTTRH